METLRIAHISDLHFSKWSLGLKQFFSKQWLGNFNSLLLRSNTLLHERLESLPQVFKELAITHLFITGDLSTTSAHAEFKKALSFIQEFEKAGIEVFCIPGNHDQYTKKAYKLELFYHYFPCKWDSSCYYDLKEHGLTAKKIFSKWWVIGLDTAVPTSWISSCGYFSEKTELYLKEFLTQLPLEEKGIILNHFPFFERESPRKCLIRGDQLKEIIQSFPQIKIFCHGHTHQHSLADLQSDQLPIIIDSGCTPHRDDGFWNLINLSLGTIRVEVFSWENHTWGCQREETFALV